MFDILKKLVLLLCFATVSFAIEPASAKRRFPTRARANESIEESIGRLKYDEASGKRMLTAVEADLKKLVGDEDFASIKAGDCPRFRCVQGSRRRSASVLDSRRRRLTRQLSEIAQERIALTMMFDQMNAPLAANTISQPGVTQQVPGQAVSAGSASSSTGGTPGAPLTNPMMPEPDKPAAPAAPASGQQPGAPPVNGAALSPTSMGGGASN